MKKLLSDPDLGVCDELRRMLASHGIEAEIRNTAPGPVLGGRDTPICSVTPELWVVDEGQFEDALGLLDLADTPMTEPEEDEAG
jgi:hypothetical protein